jgi:uncharacterized protein (TIGR00159 family)
MDWDVIAERLRWQDAADIAILTVLGYRVYRWLRGTVALQVLGGMGMVVIAALAAGRAGLVLTSYVLQAVTAVAALAAVVVFQDEIRRALRGADPVAWWRRLRADSTRAPASALYDELASGLCELASERVGALVVIPRADDISGHVTAGTRMDARVSAELLAAIFYETSPLHDGAAVIRGHRIERAGAFLPLASGSSLPEHFGTRHRAAVGLSEVCDAITIAVSEERGVISIASDGRLATAPQAPEELAGFLERAVRTPGGAPAARQATAYDSDVDPRRRRMANAIALAVIFAGVTGAWFALAGDRSTLITNSRPIELRNVSAGLEVTVVEPASGEVAVRLRGPRQLLYSQARQEVIAFVRLTGLARGRHRLAVETSAPAGLEVVGVDPAEIVVRVGREGE